MKTAVGISDVEGFPYQLAPAPSGGWGALPIWAIDVLQRSVESVTTTFKKTQRVYVPPSYYFEVLFRDIFINTVIKHVTAKEFRAWMAEPKMKYRPQQLNFALWFATTGCGVSREILEEGGKLNLPPQLRCFFLFHVYFTTRRIQWIFQLRGVGDPKHEFFARRHHIQPKKKKSQQHRFLQTNLQWIWHWFEQRL